MQTNISPLDTLSKFLLTIAQPARLQILLAIGDQETCVCHLEAALGYRQAYLSQHLMALRQAGLVQPRRQGRFMHYRLADPACLGLIRQAAELQHLSLPQLAPSCTCSCPNCRSEPHEQPAGTCPPDRASRSGLKTVI